MSPTPKIRNCQQNTKVDHQKLFMFEGFKPDGLQIRVQRKELHISRQVKIDFDDF